MCLFVFEKASFKLCSYFSITINYCRKRLPDIASKSVMLSSDSSLYSYYEMISYFCVTNKHPLRDHLFSFLLEDM